MCALCAVRVTISVEKHTAPTIDNITTKTMQQQVAVVDEEAVAANSFRPKLVGSLMMTGTHECMCVCMIVCVCICVCTQMCTLND